MEVCEKEGVTKRMISIQETARFLGVSSQSVYVWAKRPPDPNFPRPRRIGRLLKFDIKALEAYVEGQA